LTTLQSEDLVFNPLEDFVAAYPLPERFTSSLDSDLHPLSLLAVKKLQFHLTTQQEWVHNFGLTDQEGMVIGKMFGVLVVRKCEGELGYLAAFSGKLAGGNHHAGFVPPIFDGLAEGGFLNSGMTELARMNQEIRVLEELELSEPVENQIQLLKDERKAHSATLQNEIFDQYSFLNQAGELKSLREIFRDASYKNPPVGAGECAAPKLLQYAFQQGMQPIALAEFWWGLSPKSANWKHGHFYPPCREKCAPILRHMLGGLKIQSSDL
jgi:tRNA pseudouridine32 synthase/23S rRNA pseudouridine746 synthase